MSLSKYASLQHLTPGSAEYVLAHAHWQKSRGRKPSLSFGRYKNPAQAFRIAQGMVTVSNMFEPLAALLADGKTANVGKKLFKEGKYEQAIPCLKKATGWYSDPEYPHMLAVSYAKQKTPDYLASLDAFMIALHKPDATLYDECAKPIYKDLADVLVAAAGNAKAAPFAKEIKARLGEYPDPGSYFDLYEVSFDVYSALAQREAPRQKAIARARALVPA